MVLKKISLIAPEEMELIEGEEYLIYMRVIRVEDSTLIGTILKTKRLDDCWDRS